jgi:hypothetical protein
VAAFWLGVLAADLGVVGVAADWPLLLGVALALWASALFLAAAARREVTFAPKGLRGKGLTVWAAVLPPSGVLAALVLLNQVRDLREAAAHKETEQRLRRIVLAMRVYAGDNGGRLPPAALRDSGGVPLLSWRVLLLPYLGHDDLYRRFHLDEPWDGPHNRLLLPEMPEVYAPPEAAEAEAEPFATFCQVPLGADTAFAGQFGLLVPDDLPMGVGRTALLVEAPRAVWWTRPLDQASWPGGTAGGRRHFLFGRDPVRGLHVAFGDGTVSFLTPDNEAAFRVVLSRFEPGGEVLGSNW